jgi:hypothetical protein
MLKRLKQIVEEHQYQEFTWTNDPEEEPVLVDVQTANALLTIYNALNSKNQKTFNDKLENSRGMFFALVNFAFAWKHVS